ncbi:hypothetical protein ACS0TY_000905 [Phlomoides rotata]
MMMKNKFTSPINSWEDQQIPTSNFVQEPLGGFIWPPRFYTCTFCRREFRSAQALGGHMNVHRRDRARLKQSSPPQTREILHHQEIRDLKTDFATGKVDGNVNEGFIETKLSMGIELFDSENVVCKRHKKSCNDSSPLPFLHTSSMEDIDLELRL